MIKNYAITDTELLGNSWIVRTLKLLIICLVLIRNLLIKFLLLLLSYIVPKNPKLLFFSTCGNYNFPIWRNEEDFQFKESPKYLAIYSAKKLKDYTTVFHVPNKKLFEKIKTLGIKPVKGLRAFWYMLRARYLFVDNNNFFNPNASFLIGRFRIIQTWHGTPLKSMGEDRKNASNWLEKIKNIEKDKFIYVLSPCDHSTQIFRKLFYTENILEIGLPRNDILLYPKFFSCENVYHGLNLQNYERIIVYAPTFRKIEKDVNPFNSLFFEKLNNQLKEKHYLLLIKQHPYTKITEGLSDFSNIIDVSASVQDLHELLIYTDVLITDYSSSIFDFSLTDKLQLLFPFDKEQYVFNRGPFYFEYKEENLPGLIIKDENDFVEKIEQLESLLRNQDIKAKIIEFRDKFNRYTDETCSERLFGYLGLAAEGEQQ